MAWYGDEYRRQVEEEARRAAAAAAQRTSLESADWLRNQSMKGMLDAQGRQAPQAANTRIGNVSTYGGATIDQSQQNQFRERELALADRLFGIGSGQQMGAGEMAARRQGNLAVAQQQGMARMARGSGVGSAIAARSAARNAGNIGLDTAGLARQAALSDQQMANQTAAGLLGQGRGADIGLATSQAGLRQQAGLASMDAQNQRIFQQAGLDQATSLANMQARLQQTGLNDQAALAYMAQLYGVDAAELQARIQLELGEMAKPKGGSTLGGLMTVGGTIIGGVAGGPAGAAAGGTAGGALGNGVGGG
jgi:hypothetical protein